MSAPSAVLVCDADLDFREELRNFLLAEGYSNVRVVATVPEALVRLRSGQYGCVLVGVSRSSSVVERLATVIQWRQPGARIIFLVNAQDASFVKAGAFVCLIKERAFGVLSELMASSLEIDDR